jgi:hypothetical protein
VSSTNLGSQWQAEVVHRSLAWVLTKRRWDLLPSLRVAGQPSLDLLPTFVRLLPVGVSHGWLVRPAAERRMQQTPPLDPATLARVGLCASCVHASIVTSSKGSTFYLCRLSETDPHFRKYPVLPVRSCSGYQPA